MLTKLCVYILIVILVYFLVPKKIQWWVLLAANVAFYISFGVRYLFAIVFTAAVTYTAGRLLEKENFYYRDEKTKEDCIGEKKKQYKKKFIQRKRMILLLSLLLCFGMWIALKVLGGFRDFIMPLGISYYTLMGTGYLIDLYHDKYPSEKNILKYAVFLSFFLQIVQGPVSRYQELSKTLLETHKFSLERLYEGILRISVGLLKKCIVADKISISVDYIFAGYQGLNGIYMFLGMIFWAIELYADFSGYMDIVNGAAWILGIKGAENFRQPFFAKSIEEFWRRWHITLGAWFRDYLFYPVSMSKWAQRLGKKSRTLLGNSTGRMLPSYIALLLVWSATGMWHGISLHYLFWGLMQMAVIIFSLQMAPLYQKMHVFFKVPAESRVWKCVQMVRTFLLFGFMEIMSQAHSLTEAMSMYARMFTTWNITALRHLSSFFPGMIQIDRYLILAGIILMLIVDIIREREVLVSKCLIRLPLIPRYIIYLIAGYVIVLCTSRSNGGGFMYANY